ncbi:MAG: FAD-dependent oxidoreductase, partial [Acidobacteriota bacterium]
VDLPGLMAAAGGSFVSGIAHDLNPVERKITLKDARVLSYDLVSLGIGSTPRDSLDPEVSHHSRIIKPLSRAAELKRTLFRLASQRGRPAEEVCTVVVGAGAAGIEIALAIAAVLDRAKQPRKILLLDSGPQILAGSYARFRQGVTRLLAARSINLRLKTRAKAVGRDHVLLEDGEKLPSHLTVWLTGAAGLPLLARSGLAVDSRGFLLVDDALRSVSDPSVHAAGDCATLSRFPDTPKAGVYAVRQGPVLWESLQAAVRNGRLPTYRPQRDFLSILNTGDGKAFLRYKGIHSHSRWAWRFKDFIDRRFMARYQHLGDHP